MAKESSDELFMGETRSTHWKAFLCHNILLRIVLRMICPASYFDWIFKTIFVMVEPNHNQITHMISFGKKLITNWNYSLCAVWWRFRWIKHILWFSLLLPLLRDYTCGCVIFILYRSISLSLSLPFTRSFSVCRAMGLLLFLLQTSFTHTKQARSKHWTSAMSTKKAYTIIHWIRNKTRRLALTQKSRKM